MKRTGLLAFSALTGTMMMGAAPLMAQQTAPSQQAQGAVEEVVVTGSRVITNGLQAPTPVTVMSADSLKDAAPGNLIVSLSQLPVLQSSQTSQNVTGAGATNRISGAASTANLRGLGASRTLTLLNGRRVVSANDGGSPDIAIFPSTLVQRVDIVTGGASAAYGSDAVAGVVNFVLDTTFQGIKGEIQGGETSRGDKKNYRANTYAGMQFGGGRGNFIVGGEIAANDGLVQCDRPEFLCGDHRWSVINNAGVTTATATEAKPLTGLYNNVQSARMNFGGVIYDGQAGAASVLSNISFGPGGTPQAFIKGANFNGTQMVGGSGDNGGDYTNLVSMTNSYSLFTIGSYDVTDAIKLTFEGELGHNALYSPSFVNRNAPTTGDFTIFSGNPFIPAAIQSIMTANNIPSFRVGRISPDWTSEATKFVSGGRPSSPTEFQAKNGMHRIAVALDGQLTDTWSFGVNYTYGWNGVYARTINLLNLERSFLASDAIRDPVSGAIVCNVKFKNPNSTDPNIKNCVPVNIFGLGSASDEAVNYVVGTAVTDRVNTQHFGELSVKGQPFSTWAGPVSLGFGATYRRDGLKQTSDGQQEVIGRGPNDPVFGGAGRSVPAGNLGRFGNWIFSINPGFSGVVGVQEGYGEVLVPLAVDNSWAKSLDFNAAVRYSHYDLSGGALTWKAGAVYEPLDGVRLRATRSRDIRAPNAFELFTPPRAGGTLGVRDPANGGLLVSGGQGVTTGNPNLEPEKGDTTTVGITVQPDFLPGFGASVDWWSLDMKGAITSLGTQRIVDQCYAGVTYYCQFVRRDTAGQLSQVFDSTVNANYEKNNGVDAELNYAARLDDLFPSISGGVVFRLIATYYGKKETLVPGDVPNDVVGGLTAPRWRGNFTAQYSNGPWSFIWSERYIGPVMFSTGTQADPKTISAHDNRIKPIFYANVTARYKFGEAENYEVFFNIANLFDRDPPASGVFSTAGSAPLSQNLYDYIGRDFRLGLRFNF